MVVEALRPRLMPLKAACRYGGFGRSKAYALIREGKIVAYKLGRRTLVDVASIDAFVASLVPCQDAHDPGLHPRPENKHQHPPLGQDGPS